MPSFYLLCALSGEFVSDDNYYAELYSRCACCMLLLATYQMVSSVDKVSGSSDDLRKLGLAQRRALILTVVGNTPVSSSLLQRILEDGYLSEVNGWLSDILNGQVGKCCTSFRGNTQGWDA